MLSTSTILSMNVFIKTVAIVLGNVCATFHGLSEQLFEQNIGLEDISSTKK